MVKLYSNLSICLSHTYANIHDKCSHVEQSVRFHSYYYRRRLVSDNYRNARYLMQFREISETVSVKDPYSRHRIIDLIT